MSRSDTYAVLGQDAGLRGMARSMHRHRHLIFALAKRDVAGRYRGSAMGLLWAFLLPLLMLAIYTFVFSVVFGARWQGGTGSKTEFALVLFCGLIGFNFFAECINKAPLLIVGNVNYVKRVQFPLEILPVVAMLSSGFHALVGLLVWLVFYLCCFGVPPATILLLPLVALPLWFLTAGLSWLLAALGVYLRDVAQVTAVLTTIRMFLSPLFYAVDALPPAYRGWMQLNPMTLVIENMRGVMLWGRGVDWSQWRWFLPMTFAFAWLGFAGFQKTRRGFADVL